MGKLKEYLKKKYAEQKKEWAEDREFVKELAIAKKKARRKALLKQEVRIASESVKAESEIRLKRHRERIGYTAQAPSVKKIVKKIKGKKGKRKKLIKKIIKASTPSAPKRATGSGFYDDITRGLPA